MVDPLRLIHHKAIIAHKINWPIALAVVGIAIAFNDNAFDAFIIDQLSKLENFTRRTALPSRFWCPEYPPKKYVFR